MLKYFKKSNKTFTKNSKEDNQWGTNQIVEENIRRDERE